jgi:hypothetical protein
MQTYEDNTKIHSVFLATTLSYAMLIRQKWGVIESFDYLGEFKEDF